MTGINEQCLETLKTLSGTIKSEVYLGPGQGRKTLESKVSLMHVRLCSEDIRQTCVSDVPTQVCV